MPAVAGLKRQGANNGAALSFLISTPESGVDSIALTYALLGPVFAVIRPVVAFVTALVAGVAENLFGGSYSDARSASPDLACPIDACCDGVDCDPEDHNRHHSFSAKLAAGMGFAFDDLMADLAVWFILGILLAGVITAFVPDTFVATHLGSGLWAYLVILAVSLPMYVCATMSTPVAAALILKGLSPGAALVLMMAGPATNVATITVVAGIMGRRALGIYLGSIVVCTLMFAFATDALFQYSGIKLQVAALSGGGELLPAWVEIVSAALLVALILRVVWTQGPIQLFRRAFSSRKPMETSDREL